MFEKSIILAMNKTQMHNDTQSSHSMDLVDAILQSKFSAHVFKLELSKFLLRIESSKLYY